MKLTRKEYTTEEEKKKDFWRGFWLWWGLNILLVITTTGISILTAPLQNYSDNALTNSIATILTIVIGLFPWLVNLGLVVYFALTRSQIALGMLVAFGVALAIVVILGIIFAVACFIMLANYQP